MNKYLSIIIDTMDQAKTYLPHFLYNGEFTNNMRKLRLNFVVVIMHGIGKYLIIQLFVVCLEFLVPLEKKKYIKYITLFGFLKNNHKKTLE